MRLYKRNAKGEPQFWDISELPNRNISLKYGLVCGTTHSEEVARKLIKANEIESRIKAKRKEGYKELSELKDGGPDTIDDWFSLRSYLDTYLPKNNTTADGFVLPMLAKVLKDNKPFTKGSYLGQYKINGVRCIIGAEKTDDMFKPIKLIYHSREGADWTSNLAWMDDVIIPFLTKDLIEDMIDEGVCLDGELYLPGHKVNDINSFVKNPALPQHYLLQYWCYDILIENMSYAARYKAKHEMIKRIAYDFEDITYHLNNKSKFVLLPDVTVTNFDDATRYRDKFINMGFEGLIIRDRDAEYQFGKRNSAMFKFKRVDDGLFEIVDIVPEGVRSNLCKLVLRNDINSELFECTLNAPHAYQENVLNNKSNFIGDKAIVEFRERSGVKNVPFHAKCIRIKH